MENNIEAKGSFKGLIPFIVFILLYLGTGIKPLKLPLVSTLFSIYLPLSFH